MAAAKRDGGILSLDKDGGISLSKDDGLSKIRVLLGWNVDDYEGDFDFDLDAEAFLLNSKGRVRANGDLVFYGNLEHNSGAVIHKGDDTRGFEGEEILVDLDKIPANVERVVFTVTIADAGFREQNFGMVENAYITILDESNGKELITCQMADNYGEETALEAGELVRYHGEWKFRPLRNASQDELYDLCEKYGVKVK